MKASSIKKKVKDPAFAAKVDRRTIYVGCEHLGVPVDEHIGNVAGFLAVME
jgi:predicted hydrolase (HD superfamily)